MKKLTINTNIAECDGLAWKWALYRGNLVEVKSQGRLQSHTWGSYKEENWMLRQTRREVACVHTA